MGYVKHQIEHRRYRPPDIAHHVIEIATTGAIPVYNGPGDPTPMESGLLYDRRKSLPVVKKFWKWIREGETMAASEAVASMDHAEKPCPASVAQGKLPGR